MCTPEPTSQVVPGACWLLLKSVAKMYFTKILHCFLLFYMHVYKSLVARSQAAIQHDNVRRKLLFYISATAGKGKPSPFPVCVAYLTVSVQLGKYLYSVCREVRHFHSNYNRSNVLVTKTVTQRNFYQLTEKNKQFPRNICQTPEEYRFFPSGSDYQRVTDKSVGMVYKSFGNHFSWNCPVGGLCDWVLIHLIVHCHPDCHTSTMANKLTLRG